jgi:KaiC/GvpD/RAD55 family RecA-like ATPase
MSGDNGRFATGVPGLDAVLGGGVFDGGIYIIQGAPGAGKTILGNQICFAQAAQGRNALYITLLAESHARMIGHMRRMTFFDEAAVPDRMSYVGAFKTLEDDGLRGLLDVVRREVRTRNASILVLDGLITVHEKARSELELKKFIHELQTQAAFSNCTMFLLTSAFDADAHPPEHTMVDGLIELQSSLHGRRAERSLQVHKLRGSWFMGGKHSYRITENGHGIYPRIEALLETPSVWDSADGPMVSVGIGGVDKMLGGGVDTHSVTVVLGPSGSGKTTAALQFLTGGPADEPAMLFGFHENPMAAESAGRQDHAVVAPADGSGARRGRYRTADVDQTERCAAPGDRRNRGLFQTDRRKDTHRVFFVGAVQRVARTRCYHAGDSGNGPRWHDTRAAAQGCQPDGSFGGCRKHHRAASCSPALGKPSSDDHSEIARPSDRYAHAAL